MSFGPSTAYNQTELLFQSEGPQYTTTKRVSSVTGPRRDSLPTPPYTNTDVNSMTTRPTSQNTPVSGNVQNSPVSTTEAEAPPTASKPRRVRTGCLTCRKRHLKCDEAFPLCMNCKKSNRECKRGIRLNFHDTTVKEPPQLLPRTHDWKVVFQDDSRDIASEYAGGEERYEALVRSPKRRKTSRSTVFTPMAAPIMAHQSLPTPQTSYQSYGDQQSMYNGSTEGYDEAMQQMQAYATQTQVQPFARQSISQGENSHPLPLQDRTEILYMQVFVEEVGLWMDSMDADKHFSRLIPFQALQEPMLKYALLACGVRHLTLVNPTAYPDAHALNYYNSATQLLLKSLQNPDRDSVLCATTATILNVYEVMSEKALQRMNHIAGARALIKECRWDANATGIGAACFWLNVGLELFSCLHFNWGIAWDPDTWGIDMTMNPQAVGGNGSEEEWTHKVLWILAKVTNFRSKAPRFQEQTVQAEQMRMQQRYQEWLGLKQFCDRWERCVPITMQAMANLPSYGASSKSAFPEVWFIKRTTIVARLFYHTAMTLLGAVYPINNIDQQTAAEMAELRLYHSRQICGIVAHVKDRGLASASIRCLAVAGENLTVKVEQEEVLEIFEKIKKETGWRVAFIGDDLKAKWGWNNNGDFDANSGSAFYQQGQATMPPVTNRQRMPSGIINPLYKNADFAASNPPYQGSYVPLALHNAQMYGFTGIAAM